MNHLSLFSGIGGADLAAAWAGIDTVAHSEIDPYCIRVLEKNFPGVPNLGDIKTLTRESFYDATGLRSVDIISGGFPCQPWSCAGKQRGTSDDRHLWPEMLRVIKELRPTWIIGENVAGFINMALDDALSDLEAEGYKARPFVLPACSVGAPHQRNRVFIVGYAKHHGSLAAEVTRGTGETRHDLTQGQDTTWESERTGIRRSHADVADTYSKRQLQQKRCIIKVRDWPCHGGEPPTNTCCLRCEEAGSVSSGQDKTHAKPSSSNRNDWWAAEPCVGRVAHGVPSRVDRIRALGNAIVPQQIYPIFEAIREVSHGQ